MRQGSVSVDGEVAAHIGRGVVALVGVGREDVDGDADYLAQKIASLRMFPRDEAEFDLSLLDTGGQVLAVSQFTLMADIRKGRRPSFTDAAPPEQALPLYKRFVETLRALNIDVKTGVFQQYMQVEIHNDGPVTILLDSRHRK